MITMSTLGKNGRLGNQLFQFSFLFGLYKQKGYEFYLPPDTGYYKKMDKYNNSSSIYDIFDLNHYIKQKKIKLPELKERHYHYDALKYKEYSDNKDYVGYFQSPKYFDNYKLELLQILQFKQTYTKNFSDYSDIVSLHVRRTDFLENSIHTVNLVKYIIDAKQHFSNKKFLVFSDDIDWCKTNHIGDYYSTNNNDGHDLYEMSLCSSSIIANSTFSWWGAYLGNMKEKVIAPRNWFTKLSINSSDIYCKDWIVI